MLKKRYLFLMMIFCLLIISAVSAEEIGANDTQLSANIDEIDSVSSSNISSIDEQDATKTDDDILTAGDDSILNANNVIYFDSSVSTDGDGSKSKPFKNVNQNTLGKYIGSGNTLTAYFANGNYNLNTHFIIYSSSVVIIGSGNTVFNSVLTHKYDFEIMRNANVQLSNITFNHINIQNHGTLKAYNSYFENGGSFTGYNSPLTYNADQDSSYGGMIICDPIGNSNPYVYLEKCTFTNTIAYCGGTVSLKNSSLKVNNCKFNYSEAKLKGGVIYALNSNISIYDSDFEWNNASYGGVIYCEKSVLDLKDTYLLGSIANSFGGVIASKYSDINIESCQVYYSGSLTDAGGAIYNFKGKLKVDDSDFYICKAEFGGAICNLESELTILSSSFKRCTAGHGGVIYNIYGKMYIEDNVFYNSTAYTGSIICSKLSDISYVINNTFVQSPTRDNSSCIFLDSCAEDLIQYGNHFEDRFYIQLELSDTLNGIETTIYSNVLTYALSNTGTYYDIYENIDYGGSSSNYANVKIFDIDYPNNSTVYKNYNDNLEVIFNVTILNDGFNNPMFKIRAYNYLGDLIIDIPAYVEDYKMGSGKGMIPVSFKSQMLINGTSRLTVEDALVSSINSNPSNLNYLPSSYDSRDYGYITPVKNQGRGGNCWAFAGIATLEACIKKATGITYDFSEENVKNMMATYSTMGLDMQPNQGGFDAMVMGYLASWFGPVVEETDPYDEFSSLSNAFYPKFHVQNICFLPQRDGEEYDYIYKKAIMDYGAIAITFNISGEGLHSVSIVGWDDNYNNFDSFEEYTKGAWIFKNSWGDDWGDNGFGYLSYSTHFTSDDYVNWHAYSFIFSENDNYNVNVHPDFSGVNNYIFNDGPITCSIKVGGPEHVYTRLSAFATYFRIPTDYTIDIYDLNKYGTLIFTQDGHSEAGYYTIPLYRTVLVNPGDSHLISITFNNEEANFLPVCQAEKLTKAHFQETGQYFIDDGYGYVEDLINLKGYYIFLYNGTLSNTCQVPSIHLFTNNVMPYETIINVSEFESVDVGGSVTINITFSDVWSVTNLYSNTTSMIEGSLVSLNIGGKSYYAMIHDGKASLKVKFDSGGDYTLTAQYKNNKFTSNVVEFDFEVKKKKTSLTGNSVSKIYGGSEKSVVTLKDNNGQPIKNTEITFSINGRSTTIKTNAKGQATMALSLAPKTYTATVKYAGNSKYSNATAKVKIVVKKATPKITASKKIFKLKAKAKKYTVTLKNNKGQVMKSTQMTLTIKGKTYKAKTNNKGQATFALKLTKIGNYKAIVKFAGTKYYNAVTKKVPIVVRK